MHARDLVRKLLTLAVPTVYLVMYWDLMRSEEMNPREERRLVFPNITRAMSGPQCGPKPLH